MHKQLWYFLIIILSTFLYSHHTDALLVFYIKLYKVNGTPVMYASTWVVVLLL